MAQFFLDGTKMSGIHGQMATTKGYWEVLGEYYKMKIQMAPTLTFEGSSLPARVEW